MKYNFSFSYKANQGDYEDMDYESDFEEADITEIAGEIVGNYEFPFCE